MLTFDPSRRITCEEALNHPYLSVWHDPSKRDICIGVVLMFDAELIDLDDEPTCQYDVDFAFEDEESTEGMKALIMDEVSLFRQEVRNQARGWEQSHNYQQ